jgi:hypothetical protein
MDFVDSWRSNNIITFLLEKWKQRLQPNSTREIHIGYLKVHKEWWIEKTDAINHIEFFCGCIEKSSLKILPLNNDRRISKKKYRYRRLDEKPGIIYSWWDES